MSTEALDPRAPQRVRHDTKLRLLTVTAVTDITPLMRRIRLTGDMEGFVSPGHADHIKAFFFPEGVTPLLPVIGPNGAEFEPGTRPEMRDYAPLLEHRRRLDRTRFRPPRRWPCLKLGGSRCPGQDPRHWRPARLHGRPHHL